MKRRKAPAGIFFKVSRKFNLLVDFHAPTQGSRAEAGEQIAEIQQPFASFSDN